MPLLSPEILSLLLPFAPLMTAPTFANALTLLVGTILAPGRRTVTAALRVQGLGEHRNFGKYHRVLSRAHWSCLGASRLLLALLLRCFLPPEAPLVVLADDTLERRRSAKLPYRGLFRDAVRSTIRHVQLSWGIRWLCLALLVPVPWSRRPWALPFLVLPLPSEKACQRRGRRHRTAPEWLALAVRCLRRWHPRRQLVVVGDGTYAALPLVAHCQQQPQPVRLVSRLRLDAVLHDFPGERPPGKRGPAPKKGARQPSLAARLTDPATPWQRVTLRWYGGEAREVEVASGVSLWYRGGHAPVPLRWVLVRAPEGDPHPLVPGACFCSDPEATPVQILSWFIGRWNIEVTFAELRAHLGFETQRHWAARAVARTTPCLCGLFSLVVVLAQALHPETLPVPQQAWYAKPEATFSDALAAVRGHLWRTLLRGGKPVTSPSAPESYVIPCALWERLEQVACYAP